MIQQLPKGDIVIKAISISVAMTACLTALAQPPGLIDYQGRIVIDGAAYNGTGYFKLAISDAGGTNTWTQDGTSVGVTAAPTDYLTNAVNSGVFSLMLGDTALGMTALTADLFNREACYLRVWFATTAAGPFTEMLPAQRLTSVPYALNTSGLGTAAASDVDAFASAEQGLKADTALQADGSVGLEGDLNLNGNRIVNLAGPQNDTDGISKEYFWATLTNMPPMGGLSMGVYTNR